MRSTTKCDTANRQMDAGTERAITQNRKNLAALSSLFFFPSVHFRGETEYWAGWEDDWRRRQCKGGVIVYWSSKNPPTFLFLYC